jgi:hypothetical protein
MAAGWRKNLLRVELNLQQYARDVDRDMLEATKQGARIWLQTALSTVPTWSRASRATFESLAQSVGFRVTYGPITAFYDRKPLGTSNGFGGLIKDEQGKYSFYYSSTLEYLNFNESNHAPVGTAGVRWGLLNATPYNFVEAANASFEQFAKNVSLPPVNPRVRKL